MSKKSLAPSVQEAAIVAEEIRMSATPQSDFHFKVFGSFPPALIPRRADNPITTPQNNRILDPGFFPKGRVFQKK